MKNLFSLFKLKDLTIKNRIVMPPMCMYSAENGLANAFHIQHYTTRAIGGVGLVIVEATGLHRMAEFQTIVLAFGRMSRLTHRELLWGE